MQWLVEVGLSNALAAFVLALVAWTTGKIMRRPAVTHALWLLVLLKLLTPPIIELPLPVAISRTVVFDSAVLDGPRQHAAALSSEMPTRSLHDRQLVRQPDGEENRSLISAFEQPVESRRIEQQLSEAARASFNQSAHTTSASPSLESDNVAPHVAIVRGETRDSMLPDAASWARWRQFAALVWLVGLTAWIVLQIALGLRLLAMVRASSPAPAQLSGAANEIARRMGLKNCPRVRIVSGIGSPMLCGLGSGATILMPAALLRRLDPEAQATVLAHELAHYRRGDQWVRLVELVVTGLYWWNPVVWLARHQIEVAEEQCCDAHVIETCSGKTRVYAEALLDIVDLISESARRMRPAMSSGIGQRPLLQKRLVDLMRRRCAPTMTSLARRVILVTGAVSLACHPALFVNEVPVASAATANASAELAFGGPVAAGLVPAESASDHRLGRSVPATRAGATDFPSPPRGDEINAAEDIEWATAISPNGRFHITVRRGYDCQLREVTSDQIRRLTGHRITCVAFAADSARFVTADMQGAVRLWDSHSGEVLQTLTQRDGPVYSVCLAPSGEHAVVAGQDGVVELLSLTSASDRQVVARLDAPVRCARFSPDGSRLAVVTDTWRNTAAGTVAVYHVATGARLLQWHVTGPLGAVDFPAEDRLITIDWSGRVREWSLPGLVDEELSPIAKELVSAASFSVDSRVLEGLRKADTF